MNYEEGAISSAGKLHGWYIFHTSSDWVTVWIDGFTARESVEDILPRFHFSEVRITPAPWLDIVLPT